MRTHRGTSRTHHHGRAHTPLVVFSTLAIVASLFAAVTVAGEAPASAARTSGEVVKYDFTQGAGTTVVDSGSGAPLNLTISNPGNVSWGPGGLTVNSNTVIASAGAASKVTNAVQASNQMTVEAWVAPASANQSGPARIVTSTSSPLVDANFMLGQGAWGSLPSNAYAARFNATGTPTADTMLTPAGTATTNLTHVALTRTTTGTQTLYVNGVAQATSTRTGTTSNWNTTFPLTIANAPTGNRPWLGTVCLVAVYDAALSAGQVSDNFAAGCDPTPNTDPVLDPVADQTNDEGDTVLVDVNATDTDTGDVLVYSATNLPDGLTIDPATGEVTGTITQTAATGSVYSVDLTVDDQKGGTDTTTIDWTVNPVNVAPVLDPIGDQTSGQGQTVSLTVTASDDDNDDLLFTATGLPTGWTIDPTTGEITGTSPAPDSVTVTVTVDDQNGATDDETFTWTIVGNTAPVLDPVADQTNDEGDTVTLDVDATDDDGDTLVYSATEPARRPRHQPHDRTHHRHHHPNRRRQLPLRRRPHRRRPEGRHRHHHHHLDRRRRPGHRAHTDRPLRLHRRQRHHGRRLRLRRAAESDHQQPRQRVVGARWRLDRQFVDGDRVGGCGVEGDQRRAGVQPDDRRSLGRTRISQPVRPGPHRHQHQLTPRRRQLHARPGRLGLTPQQRLRRPLQRHRHPHRRHHAHPSRHRHHQPHPRRPHPHHNGHPDALRQRRGPGHLHPHRHHQQLEHHLPPFPRQRPHRQPPLARHDVPGRDLRPGAVRLGGG